MGLDMYAYTTAEKVSEVDFDVSDSAELYYWRKFNALHGWMQDLYYAKGGKSADFNCDNVRIDLDDLDALEEVLKKGLLQPVDGFFLDALEEVLKKGLLQPVDGFFFGGQTIKAYQIESASEFIVKARAAIAKGLTVYYSSWW